MFLKDTDKLQMMYPQINAAINRSICGWLWYLYSFSRKRCCIQIKIKVVWRIWSSMKKMSLQLASLPDS